MRIQKSFRKTTTLGIDKNGEVVIRASYFTSKKAILNFVEKHKDWIEKKQKEVLQSKKNFKE
ncbi:MAG: M48 family metallopeptidase [Candidatus Peribacteria bacterium]|jgi:predicted metal-dependent hydrolase|nr:M48 family metallopeptidase [Candidatus Peribacteria bacterium]